MFKRKKHESLPLTVDQLEHAGPPPSGGYLLRITFAKRVPGFNGGEDRLVVDFAVAAGPHEHHAFREVFFFGPSGRADLRRLYEVTGAMPKFAGESVTAEALIGRELLAEVAVDACTEGVQFVTMEPVE